MSQTNLQKNERKLLARGVLGRIVDSLDNEGLGKNPDLIRNKLLEGSLADILIMTEFEQEDEGVLIALQAVSVKTGEILASTQEYTIRYQK